MGITDWLEMEYEDRHYIPDDEPNYHFIEAEDILYPEDDED